MKAAAVTADVDTKEAFDHVIAGVLTANNDPKRKHHPKIGYLFSATQAEMARDRYYNNVPVPMHAEGYSIVHSKIVSCTLIDSNDMIVCYDSAKFNQLPLATKNALTAIGVKPVPIRNIKRRIVPMLPISVDPKHLVKFNDIGYFAMSAMLHKDIIDKPFEFSGVASIEMALAKNGMNALGDSNGNYMDEPVLNITQTLFETYLAIHNDWYFLKAVLSTSMLPFFGLDNNFNDNSNTGAFRAALFHKESVRSPGSIGKMIANVQNDVFSKTTYNEVVILLFRMLALDEDTVWALTSAIRFALKYVFVSNVTIEYESVVSKIETIMCYSQSDNLFEMKIPVLKKLYNAMSSKIIELCYISAVNISAYDILISKKMWCPLMFAVVDGLISNRVLPPIRLSMSSLENELLKAMFAVCDKSATDVFKDIIVAVVTNFMVSTEYRTDFADDPKLIRRYFSFSADDPMAIAKFVDTGHDPNAG
eukprot:TRINITY_DN6066_c0_g1_i5.p1 TRINITY_DN6066_c0_g1~~TRINITY_DN6066_c0_g1_i5.p1  ORF type:complete len:477 (-),score=29.05 TRINITY_DN6066_c0_g1_i5:433-1863(-)